jgi:hypothetical protein
LNCGFNLPQVIDAGIGLRSSAVVQEAGKGDRRQQANDGYDYHYFHQRESCHTQDFGSFHSVFLLSQCELHSGRLTIDHGIAHHGLTFVNLAVPMPNRKLKTTENLSLQGHKNKKARNQSFGLFV